MAPQRRAPKKWDDHRLAGCFLGLLRSGQLNDPRIWESVSKCWPTETHDVAPSSKSLIERTKILKKAHGVPDNGGHRRQAPTKVTRHRQPAPNPGRDRRDNPLTPPTSASNSSDDMPALSGREAARLKKKLAQFDDDDEETRAAHARAREMVERMNGIRAARPLTPADDVDEDQEKDRVPTGRTTRGMLLPRKRQRRAVPDGDDEDEEQLPPKYRRSSAADHESTEKIPAEKVSSSTVQQYEAMYESIRYDKPAMEKATQTARKGELFLIQNDSDGVVQAVFCGSAQKREREIKKEPIEFIGLPDIAAKSAAQNKSAKTVHLRNEKDIDLERNSGPRRLDASKLEAVKFEQRRLDSSRMEVLGLEPEGVGMRGKEAPVRRNILGFGGLAVRRYSRKRLK